MEIVIDGVIYQRQSHGGISRLYTEILPRMCEMDENLQIMVLTDGPLKQSLPVHSRITPIKAPPIKHTLQASGVWRFIPFPIRNLGRKLWYNLRSLWIDQRKDVIWHSTYYTLPSFWSGSQVVTVHDMIHERFPDLYNEPLDDLARQQKRRCIHEADVVICVSEATRRDVQSFYSVDASSIKVIPNACSNVFRQIEHRDDDLFAPTSQPFLLYVGKRGRYKSFDGLIQAYSVWPRCKEVALVVVGEPWSPAEKERLNHLGVQEQIFLLSGINDEALSHLYNRAAAYVCPSLYEGFGIPLLEAMSCGCPIVASLIPSTIEVAGDYPFYFELFETESLLAAFDIALEEGQNPHRLQLGLERVKQFSWEETARKTLEVYYDLQ